MRTLKLVRMKVLLIKVEANPEKGPAAINQKV